MSYEEFLYDDNDELTLEVGMQWRTIKDCWIEHVGNEWTPCVLASDEKLHTYGTYPNYSAACSRLVVALVDDWDEEPFKIVPSEPGSATRLPARWPTP